MLTLWSTEPCAGPQSLHITHWDDLNMSKSWVGFDLDGTLLSYQSEPIEGGFEFARSLKSLGAKTCLVTYNQKAFASDTMYESLMQAMGHTKYSNDIDMICAKIDPITGRISEAHLRPDIKILRRNTQEKQAIQDGYQPLGWTRGKGMLISPIVSTFDNIQSDIVRQPSSLPYINKGLASAALWQALHMDPQNVWFFDDQKGIIQSFKGAMKANGYGNRTKVVRCAF